MDTLARVAYSRLTHSRRLRGRGMIMRRLSVPILSVFLLIGYASSSPAVDLQPHRAIYRMVLANDARHSDVVSADGLMVYRFARSCDGWTVESQSFLRLLYADDSQTETLWSFASWESKDGRRYRFHTRYDQDGKTIEKLEGRATLNKVGGAGRARFSQPPNKVISLPSGTLFPTEHVRRMIVAAERGKHRLKRVVFDGLSSDSPNLVNAVFGPLARETAEAQAKTMRIPVKPAWWTRIAFFPLANRDELPDFEMAANYRSDGIADRIVQNFETFALEVQVKDMELLPPPDC